MTDLTDDDLLALAAVLAPPGEAGAHPGDAAPGAGLQSARAAAEATGPRDRLAQADDALRGFLSREFPDEPARLDALDAAIAAARAGMEVLLAGGGDPGVPLPLIRAGLEAVVIADGTRPAYLVADGDILFDSSSAGPHAVHLAEQAGPLAAAVRGTGRVDLIHPRMRYAGTAWRVGPDLVVTNRHVAQHLADFDTDDGHPRLRAARAPHVDFGHQLRGGPAPRVAVRGIVFCGAQAIPDGPLDHALLDLALLRTDPVATCTPPLGIGLGDALAAEGEVIAVLGHPGEPHPQALGTVDATKAAMDLIFAGLWGKKRVSPGLLRPGSAGLRHDASTLGGSSGAAMVSLRAAPLVVGLHYGGARSVNFGHRLEAVLDEPGLPGRDHPGYRTLRDVVRAEGIALVPFAAAPGG